MPGSGVLRPRTAFEITYPMVRDLAADSIPWPVTCRTLGFIIQAFYKRHKTTVSQCDRDSARLMDATLDIHHDDPASTTDRVTRDEIACKATGSVTVPLACFPASGGHRIVCDAH